MIFNCLTVLQISGIRPSFNFPSNSENTNKIIINKMSSEAEETLKRIQSHRGVIGTIVVNNEGIPIKTTLDNSTTVQYIGLFTNLIARARSTVRDLDPQNDLQFLRIGSVKWKLSSDSYTASRTMMEYFSSLADMLMLPEESSHKHFINTMLIEI